MVLYCVNKSLNKRSLIKTGVCDPRATCGPQRFQWPAEAINNTEIFSNLALNLNRD